MNALPLESETIQIEVIPANWHETSGLITRSYDISGESAMSHKDIVAAAMQIITELELQRFVITNFVLSTYYMDHINGGTLMVSYVEKL